MPKDMKTEKKIPHSSLCKKVNFKVPTSWGELTQEQLRHIFKLFFVYGEEPDGMMSVKLWALQYFCRFRVIRKTDAGWLCKLADGGSFILNPNLLPSILEQLQWLEHPENLTVRIEKIGEHQAVNMWLQEYPFGDYLKLENYYQGYLTNRNPESLEAMGRLLYQVPDDAEFPFGSYLPLSVFLWYGAIKKKLADTFTHFFKPSAAGNRAGTQESQFEMTQAQIRLLTKGDVTKYQQVIDADTWQALAELDALARESEEFKKKYGK